MDLDPGKLPDNVATLKALLIAEHKRAVDAETRALDLDAEIENLKLTIAKLQHDKHGKSSERTLVLMDQLQLQLGELVARRAQETAADEIAAAQTPASDAAKPEPRAPRRKPARRPHDRKLPRERRAAPTPTACPPSARKPKPFRTVAAHNSSYFSARPRAFSTGYFSALRRIFASTAPATSMPVILANSSA